MTLNDLLYRKYIMWSRPSKIRIVQTVIFFLDVCFSKKKKKKLVILTIMIMYQDGPLFVAVVGNNVMHNYKIMILITR